MFNPFLRFQENFIPAFRSQKKRYLICQTFDRENTLFREMNKTYLLLSHYGDPGLARLHYNAISFDRHRNAFDLEKEDERQEVINMLKPDSPYIVYSSLTIDNNEVKKATDKIFSDKIQKYIRQKTNWRIGGDQTIIPKLEITFGELFVVLKYGATQPKRIRLEELENI